MYEFQDEQIREQKSIFGVNDIEHIEIGGEELREPKSLFAEDSGGEDMQKLGLNDETSNEQPKGFWRRQFQPEATHSQRKFDWAFGVVLPVICMMADPILFKGQGFVHGIPLLGFAKPFAYLLSFSSIVMMAGWLILGKRIGKFGGPIAGLFIAGSAVSLLVGIVILPLSIIGMVFIIGFLGYMPLLSALVYFRNGLRAFRSAGVFIEKRVLLATAILSATFSLVVPYVVNREVSRYVDEMVSGDVAITYNHADNIKYIAPLVDFHALGGKYCNTPDRPEHLALADVYFRFTGGNIEDVDFPICNDF